MIFKSLKAHVSRHALLTFAACTLIQTAAMAQQAPVFTPAAGWEVNAGQLSNVRGLKAMKLPCVISTEYDNGYVVRFSGGGNKMLALAIDFRQDVFKQGRQYDAMLSVGTGYVKQVKASAFTASTLIFNLRPLDDFYSVAQNGGELEIAIEDNTLRFSLGRLGAAYSELESCYAGGNVALVQPVTTQTASKALVAAVESEPVNVAANTAPQPLKPEDVVAKPLPKSFDEIVQNSDAEEGVAPKQMKVSQVTPKPAAPLKPVQKSEPAAAAKIAPPVQEKPSEDMLPLPTSAEPKRTVSRAIPDDDGMASMAPAQIAPPAVAATPSAPIPVLASEKPDAKQVPVAPMPAAIAMAPAPAPVPAPTVWEAKAGEDMKIVLSRWSERAGYDLQWQSDQDGKVAQDVKLSGSFEDAVGQLMAENSAATGIGAHVETTAGATKDIGPKISRAAESPTQKAPPVQATIPAMHDQWTAAPGANIQTILDQWSSKAGVAIVWQSYMNVAVKQPLSVSGTYEDAVQALLDQYMNDSRRPVAQLNVDPETGVRTLLVDISG